MRTRTPLWPAGPSFSPAILSIDPTIARGSGAWQKFKVNNEQEFVIGGYRPDGKNFDALLVGYYEGRQLMFAGKVRAGFTPALRASLWKRVQPMETAKCP